MLGFYSDVYVWQLLGQLRTSKEQLPFYLLNSYVKLKQTNYNEISFKIVIQLVAQRSGNSNDFCTIVECTMPPKYNDWFEQYNRGRPAAKTKLLIENAFTAQLTGLIWNQSQWLWRRWATKNKRTRSKLTRQAQRFEKVYKRCRGDKIE